MILYGEVWEGKDIGDVTMVHFVWFDGKEFMKTFPLGTI